MKNYTWEIETLINNLVRQYPAWPSTFSTCECGRKMARGGGKCALCIEEDLAKYIGSILTAKLHKTIKEFSDIKGKALEIGMDLDEEVWA